MAADHADGPSFEVCAEQVTDQQVGICVGMFTACSCTCIVYVDALISQQRLIFVTPAQSRKITATLSVISKMLS